MFLRRAQTSNFVSARREDKETKLAREARAKRAQLAMEYDPRPPFAGGTSESADPELVAGLRAANAAFQKDREEVARRAAAALQIV